MFHVPRFQPDVLVKVPEVDRAKMMFPINIADFIFKDGVQVMSVHEVRRLKELNVEEGPNLDDAPYLSQNVLNLLSKKDEGPPFE